MAGKKKKPAANPTRGYATTSVASKIRETPDAADNATATVPTPQKSKDSKTASITASTSSQPTQTSATEQVKAKELTPEEFERQLEESELQLLVDKHGQKVKRDAARQKQRLETDRRLLRSQAENTYSRRWLPKDILDEALDLIQSEGRQYVSSPQVEASSKTKPLSDEDLIIRLWTLQLALLEVGFQAPQVTSALQYVTENSASIGSGAKDSTWGLEETLDWFARKCDLADLPDYDNRGHFGKSTDTPQETSSQTSTSTPLLLEADAHQRKKTNKSPKKPSIGRNGTVAPKKTTISFDGEIEPDELLPQHVQACVDLFALERPLRDQKNGDFALDEGVEMQIARLNGKLEWIEKDPLFDKYLAEKEWRDRMITLERDYALQKRSAIRASGRLPEDDESTNSDDSDVISKAAQRMADEVLAQDSDEDNMAMDDLFANLPTQEVDAKTGESMTVVKDKDGKSIRIRDFDKWTGINPTRILEEACRSRDSSARISYIDISDAPFASRHLLTINWSKAQEIAADVGIEGIEMASTSTRYVCKMATVAASDVKQSEAFIALTALFVISGSANRDEKIALRLPPPWKDLWNEYADARKEQFDAKDRQAIKTLQTVVREQRDQELEDGVLLQGAFRGRNTARDGTSTPDSTDASKKGALSPEMYQEIWRRKSSTPKYQQMLSFRQHLPMWHFRDQVVDAVEREQVVIVCGETGCGKSTQVPSFLLEHQLSLGKPCKIYCTEPRRISAISLAKRVSEELGENKGDLGTPRSLVGYSIRLEANTSRETRLTYATTGIVMRMLEGSNELNEITHLVLDEVHERSIESDFLLIVLKKLLDRRKDLRVVLMSATVDADRFSKYLGGAPVLNVPGRTFPVEVRYLEDAVELTGYQLDKRVRERFVDLDDDDLDSVQVDKSAKPDLVKSLARYSPRTRNTLSQMDEYVIDHELIVQLVSHIANDPSYRDYSKAILIFLPGIAEIRALNDMILGDRSFAERWLVYPMHSTIASEEQEAAFLIPPPGYRKIVLATNIAETGITIPDVTCVIDTGKHREMRFDERRQLSRLIDTFISRANAKQRRGRAGRVQNGLCFHLFTKLRHDTLMSDQQTPEMLRLSLQDLAIRVKICKMGGIEETLSGALDPPSAKNIRRAVDALIDVRALTAGEDLTPLGQQLARLPLDVFLGKLILLGTIYKCLDMAITVAAILSSKSPFVAPFGQRAQADTVKLGFRRGDSDLLTIYNAYQAWKRVCQSNSAAGGGEMQFCRKNFLSVQTLSNIEDLKGQLYSQLVDSGFLQVTDAEKRSIRSVRHSGGGGRRRQQVFVELPHRVNINSDNDVIAQSVIAWSFYPKLLIRDVPGGKGLRNIGNNQSISLHPSSVNKGHNELRFLSYYHIMQSKSFLNAHETSAIEPFAVALLCGDVRADLFSGVLILDGNRARFSIPDWKTMLVIKTLRLRLREMMTRAFKNPGKLPTAQHERWLEVWQKIFTQDFGKKNVGANGHGVAGGGGPIPRA